MTVERDLEIVEQLLVSEQSLPVQLRMREGLDEEQYIALRGALERLIDHYAGRPEVPKRLALAFVDVGTAFYYEPGTYPDDELARIEDAGNELSQMGQVLFGEDD